MNLLLFIAVIIIADILLSKPKKETLEKNAIAALSVAVCGVLIAIAFMVFHLPPFLIPIVVVVLLTALVLARAKRK